jgi:hypothetical protein
MAFKISIWNSDFVANATSNWMADKITVGGNMANTTTFVANTSTIR